MDKKELSGVIGEAIDQKITPRLKKIESSVEKLEFGVKKLDSKVEKIESQNKAILEQVAKNSEDIEVIKEEITDMGYTVERVETRLDTNLRRQDNISIKTSQLNRRVLRLETKKA